MKHIFLINPTAGPRDSTAALVPQITELCTAHNLEYEIETTKTRLHATRLCEKYAAEGGQVRFYACGGDGTLNEVVAGACGKANTQVAVIPCGSGNDFIRSFGNKEDFGDIHSIITGVPHPCDVIKAGKKISINICSVGFDAAVAYGIHKYRRLPFLGGAMGYNISVLEQLLKPLGTELEIHIDGQEWKGEYLFACVANGRYYGGGYHSAPLAKLDDGLLEVILVKKVSRLRIAKVVSIYKNGAHFTKAGEIAEEVRDIIEYHQGSSITICAEKPFISNTDGECIPATTFELSVLPAAITLVLPQKLKF